MSALPPRSASSRTTPGTGALQGKSDSGRASSEGSQELKAEDSFGKDASQPSMAVYHGVADPAVLSSPFFHKFARWAALFASGSALLCGAACAACPWVPLEPGASSSTQRASLGAALTLIRPAH